MKIKDSSVLTPIEEIGGILFKRDDFYRPFDDLPELSGTKARQMLILFQKIQRIFQGRVEGFVTYSSVSSPQSLIVAKVCNEYNVPCIICISAGKSDVNQVIEKHTTLNLSRQFKADIRSVAGLGYNNILKPKAEELADKYGYSLVHFGINLEEHIDVLVSSIANQVANFPDEIDNLVIPCGSGVTTAGIIVGLKKFNKNVKRIIPIQISGFDRQKDINKILSLFDIKPEYDFHIDRTYKYSEKVVQFIRPRDQLNMIYEAKAYKYMIRERKVLDIERNSKTLFYVIANNNFLY